MDITADDYRVWFEPTTSTVFFKGFLRLNGVEAYQPILDLLLKAIEANTTCTLNLKALEFLNSSGISMLSMFVVKVRQQGNFQLTLQGSDRILWQTKSLKNLQRLMPSLVLTFTA